MFRRWLPPFEGMRLLDSMEEGDLLELVREPEILHHHTNSQGEKSIEMP